MLHTPPRAQCPPARAGSFPGQKWKDDVNALASIGVRLKDGGLLVANSHPGLRRVYQGTRWEGGLWGSALSRLPGAEPTKQLRFADGVRSLAVWLPGDVIPAFDGPALDERGEF